MATLETQHLDEVIASSRRKMLTLGGAALAGLALSSVANAQATLGDNDYLNFALNLEYLEAQFYTLASAGTTIDAMGLAITGTGTAGGVTTKPGGPSACQVPFTIPLVKGYAMEIAQEERNHVSFLRTVLSTAAVAQPKLDLYNSFNTLAGLLNIGLTSFDPFSNDVYFLIGSYIFEDVGVTAYTGAAPLLTNKTYLDKAAGIQGVEAYHAGLVRTVIYGLDAASGAPDSYNKITRAISALRSTVDGTATTTARADGDDIGLGTQQVMLNGTTNVTASTIVDCTTTGSINAAATTGGTAGSTVFARTAAQVLKIVYAGVSGGGGFFPSGLNGNVK